MDDLIAKIYTRCDEVGDCWEWRGARQMKGDTPVMRYGHKQVGVRRVIAMHFNVPCDGRLVTYKCGNYLCVNPDHIQVVTRLDLQRRIGKTHPCYEDVGRKARISARQRKLSRLTAEIAERIRNDQRSQYVIAREYGISQATVSAIKRGKTWRDYSNPFTQLIK